MLYYLNKKKQDHRDPTIFGVNCQEKVKHRTQVSATKQLKAIK